MVETGFLLHMYTSEARVLWCTATTAIRLAVTTRCM